MEKRKKIYQEVLINTFSGESRKAAFAQGINRIVNFKSVNSILDILIRKGYREAEAIQVIKAETAFLIDSKINLVDINGNSIDNDKLTEYFLILDGQHRTYAVSLFNEGTSELDAKIIIPGIQVSLKDGEGIAEYINEINITKRSWETSDYVIGAANHLTEHEDKKFLEIYKKRIQTKDNPDGFPLATLNRIYCQNHSAITKTDFSLLCSGKLYKGKDHKKIIPSYNITRGENFINICLDRGFSLKEIGKRYIIEAFNNLIVKYDTGTAVEVFESLTPEDIFAMRRGGKEKCLDPALIEERLKLIKARLDNPFK